VAELDKLFAMMTERKASDLHLAVGVPIKMRIHGQLEVIVPEPLGEIEAEEMLRELVTLDQWERFRRTRDLDFAHEVPGLVRLRGNYFHHYGGIGAVFRIIPTRILSCSDLGVPRAIVDLACTPRGMVLVTGPTGSGKSTTLAAMVDYINSNMRRHIITIEEPIEFLHEDKLSVIVQREVGVNARTFEEALRGALREDPDVILVGEMRDRETVSLALTASEMGFLVLGTLHTNGAAKTIDRVVDIFPAPQQPAARLALSASLKGVISQQLLRRWNGEGRVAAYEILIGSMALSTMIREGDSSQITSLIQAGKSRGMQTMDQALAELVKNGVVSIDEAARKAHDKSAMGANE